MTLAWHFTGDTLRFGSPIPPPGHVLRYTGRLKPGFSGLHASLKLMDALGYAPGPRLHRVRLGGAIFYDDDRMVAEARTIVWSIDATKVLLACARHWAREVASLWDAPLKALEYLETGEERLRRSARAAARAVIHAARKSKDDAMIIPRAAAYVALYAATTPRHMEHEVHKIAQAAAANAATAIAEKAVSALPFEERHEAYYAAWNVARARQEKHIVKLVRKAHEEAKNV